MKLLNLDSTEYKDVVIAFKIDGRSYAFTKEQMVELLVKNEASYLTPSPVIDQKKSVASVGKSLANLVAEIRKDLNLYYSQNHWEELSDEIYGGAADAGFLDVEYYLNEMIPILLSYNGVPPVRKSRISNALYTIKHIFKKEEVDSVISKFFLKHPFLDEGKRSMPIPISKLIDR